MYAEKFTRALRKSLLVGQRFSMRQIFVCEKAAGNLLYFCRLPEGAKRKGDMRVSLRRPA